MRYPVWGSEPEEEEEPAEQALVICHVRECLDLACLAMKRSRRREEFPALMDLLLACKNAEEAVER